MTDAIEARSYLITAEKPADEWDALINYLGYTGIVSELVDPTQISTGAITETEPYSGPVVNKQDFFDFAEVRGSNSTLAGRAWACLARGQSWKIRKDENVHPNFRSSRYQSYCLVFERPPNQESFELSTELQTRFADLRLDSLEALLEKANKVNKKDIHVIMGVNVGAGVVDFLNEFVKAKRDELAVSVQTS